MQAHSAALVYARCLHLCVLSLVAVRRANSDGKDNQHGENNALHKTNVSMLCRVFCTSCRETLYVSQCHTGGEGELYAQPSLAVWNHLTRVFAFPP